MWRRDGTDHIADRTTTTQNAWIDTRASRREPRIMRVCDDGARRTRTADLLGAIRPDYDQYRSSGLCCVGLGDLSSARLAQFGSTRGSTNVVLTDNIVHAAPRAAREDD